ncbi:MAG: hypothetical protein Q8N47_27110 [Bryobacterales bacterium]|nr:hypothetical protein [Bryobacterales bacterium]
MIVLCLAWLIFAAVDAHAGEPRSRTWLENYVRQPVAQGARNVRYLAFIERRLDDKRLGLDLNFLEHGGADLSRAQTNILGRLAFCYRTPGLRYYRDPRLLDALRQGYLAAARHIGPDGFMKWPGDKAYFYEAHEQAWRLEPLLIGFIWVGGEFPAADREVIAAALGRSADWLSTHPYNQNNNRGAVWCAITTLCGIYFERPDYLRVVEKYAGPILDGVLWADGEAGEHTAQYGGGGPDSNYSYTGWAYVYLYRLFSGRDELDPKLRNAMRWFAVYNSFRAFPLVTGASVRMRQANPGNLQDLAPSLERFSHEDPFWARLAENVLEKKEKYLPEFGGHMISPLIWAMLENGRPANTFPLPDWYVNHVRMYDRTEVQYALISRGYQTGVVFRGRHKEGYYSPLRGLQTFALGREYPILLHTDGAHSTTRADGIDTAAMDTDEAVLLGDAVIAERRGTLWTLYAFTPASAVVLYGGARGAIESEWVFDPAVVSRPSLDRARRAVRFEGRQGRIYWLEGEARLADGMLAVAARPPLNAFAFSGGDFRFLERRDGELIFADRSGRYRLSFGDVLGPRGVLRGGRMPLERVR